VNVPPLLADLIRRVVAARAGITLTETAGAAAADVIILGPAAAPRPASAVPVLKISADLNHINGPGPADSTPFSPDALAALLRGISKTI